MTRNTNNFVCRGTHTLDIVVDKDTNLEDLAEHIADYHTVYRVYRNSEMLAETDVPDGTEDNVRMYGLTDYSGTAMAVSAICYNCYQVESRRQLAREWANADMHGTPYDGGPFVDVSGNEEMVCHFCDTFGGWA